MDFVDKVKDFVGKGAEASKNALEKAGTAVQEFSDKSVLKIEIKQLETKKNRIYKKLGKVVSDEFLSGNESVSLQNDAVNEIINDIKSINAEIEKKRSELPKE